MDPPYHRRDARNHADSTFMNFCGIDDSYALQDENHNTLNNGFNATKESRLDRILRQHDVDTRRDDREIIRSPEKRRRYGGNIQETNAEHSMLVNVSQSGPRSPLSPVKADFRGSERQRFSPPLRSLDEQFAQTYPSNSGQIGGHSSDKFSARFVDDKAYSYTEKVRLENRVGKLLTENEILKKELDGIRDKLQHRAQRAKNYENKYLDEERRNADYQTKFDQAVLEVETVSEENKRLKRENLKLASQMKDSREIYEAERGSFKENISQLRKVVDGINHDGKTVDEIEKVYKAKIETLRSQLDRLQFECGQRKDTEQALRKDRETLLNDKENLLKDRDVFLKKLNRQEEKLRMSEKVLDRIQPKLLQVSDLDEQNQQLKNKLDSLQRRCEEYATRNNELLRETSVLKQQPRSDLATRELQHELLEANKKIDKLTDNIGAQQNELKRHHQMNVKYHGLKRKMKRIQEVYRIPTKFYSDDDDDQNVSPLTSPRLNLVTPPTSECGDDPLDQLHSASASSAMAPVNLSAEFERYQSDGIQHDDNRSGVLEDRETPSLQSQTTPRRSSDDDEELVRALANILVKRKERNHGKGDMTQSHHDSSSPSSRPSRYNPLSYSQPLNIDKNSTNAIAEKYSTKSLTSSRLGKTVNDYKRRSASRSTLLNELLEDPTPTEVRRRRTSRSPHLRRRSLSANAFDRNNYGLSKPKSTLRRSGHRSSNNAISASQTRPIKASHKSILSRRSSNSNSGSGAHNRVAFHRSGTTQTTPSLKKSRMRFDALGLDPWK